MEFKGRDNEYLLLETITAGNYHLLKQSLAQGLTLVWNLAGPSTMRIDGVLHTLHVNQIICLTDMHKVDVEQIDTLRLVRFNRSFFCVIDHDSEVGCKGVLFFGASQVPILTIPKGDEEKFDLLWRVFVMEMEGRDSLQIDMLQMMLKRLLILCTRLYKEQKQVDTMEHGNLDLVREFNFLVETHFKVKHTVAEYAELLNRSPKTLSNLFTQYHHKTPLQIIQERKLLEARRLLRYTDKAVKEIAYETGFEDVQTFSRFFKTKEGISPTEFKQKV